MAAGRALGARRRSREVAPIVVAYSGGPDSTALLAAAAALASRGRLGPVVACHVDHGLRPGSAADAAHCAAVCAGLGVPLETCRVLVRPGNVQAAARSARYTALAEVAARLGAPRVATGHTRTDQAETLLLRLLRGAGGRGLAAIPPRRRLGAGVDVVRPLLGLGRADVLAYLEAKGLAALEDPTNASPRYLRNRVRRELLPALAALAPAAEAALARAAGLLREDDRALDAAARRRLGPAAPRASGEGPPGAARVEVAALRRAPVALRRRMVRLVWLRATGRRRGLTAGHVEAALRLLRRPGGGRIALPGGREARVSGGALAIGPAAALRSPDCDGGPPLL